MDHLNQKLLSGFLARLQQRGTAGLPPQLRKAFDEAEDSSSAEEEY